MFLPLDFDLILPKKFSLVKLRKQNIPVSFRFVTVLFRNIIVTKRNLFTTEIFPVQPKHSKIEQNCKSKCVTKYIYKKKKLCKKYYTKCKNLHKNYEFQKSTVTLQIFYLLFVNKFLNRKRDSEFSFKLANQNFVSDTVLLRVYL